MEETFLLFAAYVNHMTSEHAVQSPTVPGGGPTHSQLPQRTTQRGLRFPAAQKLTWTQTIGSEAKGAGQGWPCFHLTGPADLDIHPAADCRRTQTH